MKEIPLSLLKREKESQKQKSVDEATGGGKDTQGATKLTKEEKKKLKAERRVRIYTSPRPGERETVGKV